MVQGDVRNTMIELAAMSVRNRQEFNNIMDASGFSKYDKENCSAWFRTVHRHFTSEEIIQNVSFQDFRDMGVALLMGAAVNAFLTFGENLDLDSLSGSDDAAIIHHAYRSLKAYSLTR